MSQPLQIIDLPKQPGLVTTIYSWALRYDVTTGPDCFQVTDFTVNIRLVQLMTPVNMMFDGCFIDDSQILNIAVYKTKMLEIKQQYRDLFGRSLDYHETEDEKNKEIAHNLLIIKSKVQLKVYREIIQARNIETTVVSAEKYEKGKNKELDDLYKNIVTKLPREFFDKIDADLMKKVIPQEYLALIVARKLMPVPQSTQDLRVKAIEETQVSFTQKLESGVDSQSPSDSYKQVSQSANTSLQDHVRTSTQLYETNSGSRSQNTVYSGSSHSSIARETQAAQVLQGNHMEDSLIADPEHASDYEDDDEEEEVDAIISPIVANNPTKHKYSLEELNKVNDSIDNCVYNVEAYIVGSTPEDWSQICAKTYLPNGSGHSDPTFLNLELIITDSRPSKHPGLVLTKKNSFTVTFTQKELNSLLASQPIERSYTSLHRMNPFSNFCDREILLPFELHKRKVWSSKDQKNTIIWTARNFSIGSLMEN